MSELQRRNITGEVMPTQPVATSSALYGGQYAPVTRQDRKNERQHFTDVRQMQRRAIEEMAQVQAGLLIERAEVEAEFEMHRERKLAVMASETESHTMAGDNPVLLERLGQMDEQFARRMRLRGMSVR